MEEVEAKFDRRSADVNLIKLQARVERLEEKHDDATKAIEKLASKVDMLGDSIKKASWIVVGGAGVLYFLISGQLPKLIGLGGV
jgi:outer membrane murein-binding lipoprotein Lpp